MTKRPNWISKNEDGKDSIAVSEPRIAIAMARYGSAYPYRPNKDDQGKQTDPDRDPQAHLYHIIMSQFFSDVRTIAEWREYAVSYPDNAIAHDQLIRQTNPNVASRGIFMSEAIPKLLELVAAPQPMIDDISRMLAYLIPPGAESRAEAQKAILDDPSASANTNAKRAAAAASTKRRAANRSDKRKGPTAAQISKDGKDGLLVWPADPIGSDPTGS